MVIWTFSWQTQNNTLTEHCQETLVKYSSGVTTFCMCEALMKRTRKGRWESWPLTALYELFLSLCFYLSVQLVRSDDWLNKYWRATAHTGDDAYKLDIEIEISSYLACRPTASKVDDAMLFCKTYVRCKVSDLAACGHLVYPYRRRVSL